MEGFQIQTLRRNKIFLHPLFFGKHPHRYFPYTEKPSYKDTIEKRGKNYILVKEILQNFSGRKTFFENIFCRLFSGVL